LGMIIGIVLMAFALIQSFRDFDNDRWRNKGY